MQLSFNSPRVLLEREWQEAVVVHYEYTFNSPRVLLEHDSYEYNHYDKDDFQFS